MKILVTGANGFIGRELCNALIEKGYIVRGTVRSKESAESLPDNVEPVIIGPIGPDTYWSDALKEIDVIIHLAARVHVMNETAPDPLAAFRQVNTQGTEHLARTASSVGVQRLVYISSVKVNGDGRIEPYAVQDEPDPQDPYAVSKYEAEQALHRIAGETGMEIVVIRPPLVYGHGVGGNFLRLLEAVHRGIPLPFASINNLRSFIYLGNLVDSIITCINHSKASGQTYLVSDGEDVSTPELIKRLAKALGVTECLFPFPSFLFRLLGKLTGRADEAKRLIGSLVVDSTKIRTDLGWKPPYTMEQGLKKTAEWFKNLN